MKLYADIVEENDFNRAWTSAVQMVLMNGADLVIGGTEERKPIKDSCMLISLEGEAIKQIERKEVHPQYPFKRVDEYCREFTREFLDEYKKKADTEKFSYLYFERLSSYWDEPAVLDQLLVLKNALYTQKAYQITSNRTQGIIWYPAIDLLNNYSPCLQRIQIRYIPDNKVDVHLTWRSRDLYAAWQSNVICLIDMLNREVIRPNNCQIVRIVDFSDSLHIYRTDITEAKKVRFTGVL